MGLPGDEKYRLLCALRPGVTGWSEDFFRAFYRDLSLLEKEGLATSKVVRWRAPNGAVVARRVYGITPKGERVAERLDAVYGRVTAAHPSVLYEKAEETKMPHAETEETLGEVIKMVDEAANALSELSAALKTLQCDDEKGLVLDEAVREIVVSRFGEAKRLSGKVSGSGDRLLRTVGLLPPARW